MNIHFFTFLHTALNSIALEPLPNIEYFFTSINAIKCFVIDITITFLEHLNETTDYICLYYSHSIVPGGLDVISMATRLTCLTSFTIRVEILSSTSYGILAQSAVIPSIDVTARITTV